MDCDNETAGGGGGGSFRVIATAVTSHLRPVPPNPLVQVPFLFVFGPSPLLFTRKALTASVSLSNISHNLLPYLLVVCSYMYTTE